MFCSFFFFNHTAPTEIYTLSLHDALPICDAARRSAAQHLDPMAPRGEAARLERHRELDLDERSEEHTSELQSLRHLVCRLLLEKKKKKKKQHKTDKTKDK